MRTNNPSIFELNRKAKKARYSLDPNTRQGWKKFSMAQKQFTSCDRTKGMKSMHKAF